jgi:hypothetical protein
MAATVATVSDAVEAMAPDWELARALLGGTRAMRDAGEVYLPRWPNEEQGAYDARRKVAVLFPAYARTVQTLAAKPFSKPVTIGEDVPTRLQEFCQDIDMQGRNLDAFAADIMECALGYGLAGILVDYPTKPEGVRTLADERSLGLRPYAVQIFPWQILGWIATRKNGEWSLQQLRFMECVEEADGQYGIKKIEQVRVLMPGAWETHRQNEKKEWVLHASGTTTLGYVPFVPVYGQRTGFMQAKPPLIEVANLNVAHWQSASDQQTILHIARVPILAVIGVDDDKWTLTVGASSAVKIPLNGEMKWVEHTGKAVEAGANDLKDLEERMRQAGAELMVIDQKITATQVSTENAVGMCALQRIVQGEEDALDQMLKIFADWIGEPEGGHVTLFNDFAASTLSDATTQMIKDWVAAGLLSKETAFKELQRRGVIAADILWEDEKGLIEAEGPQLGLMQDPTSQGGAGGGIGQ